MRPYAQRSWDTLPTIATILAGVLSRDCHHPTPGACCLGFEDASKLPPRRIRYGLGEFVVPEHIGYLQVFEIDHIVVRHQLEGNFMVEVGALPLDLPVCFGPSDGGFPPPLAAFWATRHCSIGPGKVSPRVFHT